MIQVLNRGGSIKGIGATGPAGSPVWGGIIGTITDQLDLVSYIGAFGYLTATSANVLTNKTWHGSTIGTIYGGTGLTSYTTGDTLYASASNVLAKLPIGTAGQVLTVAAGIPSWTTLAPGGVTSVSGTLNRITSTGGTAPVINISASYVGQASLTTLGTISTGIWQGTALADLYIASASTWNAKQNAITTGTTAQYFRGDLSLATFPTSLSDFIDDIGTTDNIYIVDGTLIGNRLLDLGGYDLSIGNGWGNVLYATQASFKTVLMATDLTAYSSLILNGDLADPNVKFVLAASDGTGPEVKISGRATEQQVIITTGTFLISDTSLATASNGFVWKLLDQTSGEGAWATTTSGTVTSVSGTTNRITSTGGATPIIDISASYVGQSSITTLGTITTGVWNGTAIANANLANNSLTVNGTSIALGASGTVTAAAGTLTGTVLNSTVVTSSLTSVGTIGTGVWQGTVVAGLYGGTGVANSGKTITLGGNLTTSGAFATTLTSTALTSVTLPTTGTLATLAGVEVLTNKDLSSGTNTFPTLNQNTTGSAAKWTTARLLAGNSVDGSANVAFANLFIVQGTSDSGLSAAQFLGALGTGIVKNTTTTGVLSIAVAGDFPTLNQNTTGSAATLTTPRAINGVNFDGSGPITITAAASTLTGTVLNSTVVTSSLTSLGTIATGVWQGTAIADTYISSASTWNSKQAGDATLTALAAFNTNGLLTQTAADTFTGRTITGTSNRLSVSNGDGVAGNPTLDVSTSYVGQASITTLGTIGTGTWQATAIADTYISSSATWNAKESALTFSTGLARTVNTITGNLSTGIAGSQTAKGGTAASETLTLTSTAHVTKGNILFGTSAYDEVNNRLGIGITTPTELLTLKATNTSDNFVGFYDPSGNQQGQVYQTSGTTARQLLFNTPGVTGAAGVADSWIGGRFGGAANKIFFGDDGSVAWMQANHALSFYSGAGPSTAFTPQMVLATTGRLGIGQSAPSAIIHIKAGTATASTAPIKLTSGTLLGTAEAGAVEFLTDAYYGTITTGAARKTFAFLESPTFTGTVTIPTPFTLGSTSVTSTGTQLNYVNAATGTTGTTSTNLVFSTSPTLVTPTLGVASATTINKVTITAPATGSTLTILDGQTLTVNSTMTLIDTAQQAYTGTVTWTGTQPTGASNKTYSWTQVGRMVSLRINIWNTVAGAALTQLNLTLPSDCPAPQVPTGYTTNDYFGAGTGGLKTAHTSVFAASRVGLINTATTNQIRIFAASGAYIDCDIVIQYWTS